MNRIGFRTPTAPALTPAAVRATLTAFGILLILAAPGNGCGRSTRGPFTLLTNPVPVVATALNHDDLAAYLIEVRGPDRSFDVRTSVDLRVVGPELENVLRRRVVWRSPYLFVREDNGGGNAWRADVDHVFKLEGPRLRRVGNISAHFGEPGSQLRDGRFLDYYDRLEFSTLTSHAGAPRITLVMAERNARFEVLIDETWQRAKASYEDDRSQLDRLPAKPRADWDAGDFEMARTLALRCLTVTRYCARATEYEASLAAARGILDSRELGNVLEEIERVKPGELAPSFEEVFRLHPALMNVFPENGGSAPDPEPPALPPGSPLVLPSP